MQILVAGLVLVGIGAFGGCDAREIAVRMLELHRPKGFMIETVHNAGRDRNYGLFVPLNYKPDIEYPVIVFLHGFGEGGNTAKANLRVGLAPIVAERAWNFPFICIFPQSPDGHWDEDSKAASDVMACLADVSRKYSVDANRVYLTGLSTGGYGTWAVGARHREVFAALVPMGTSKNPIEFAERLTRMPIRSYHNHNDPIAPIWYDSSMCDRINMLGGRAEMFKTDGGGHNCWATAYGQMDLFKWLLQQKRRGAERPKSQPRPGFTATSVEPPPSISSPTPTPASMPMTPY